MKKLRIYCTIVFAIIYLSSFNTNAQDLSLEYELLYEVSVNLGEPIQIGKTPLGVRTIHPIIGGTFEGPKVKGKILANGGDWILMVDSTTAKLDIRAVAETDDGETIYLYSGGFIHWNPDGTYSFKLNPVFETASEKYSWLNYTIAVGVGKFTENGVAEKVYAIK